MIPARGRGSAAWLVLLVLACGDSAGDGRASADTAGDTAVPAPGSDPAGWRVTAEGYGPVRIGMDTAALRTALGPYFSPRDSLNPECDYLATAPDGPEVLFMVVAGQLVRIDVRDSTVLTAAGARIGHSEQMIGRLYGADRVIQTPHAYTDGHYLTVVPPGAGDDHRLVFETDGRAVTEYRAGLLPMVGWVEGCS